jgi:hypothetical protein
MPSHFDRFRLLNGGRSLRNEGSEPIYVGATEQDPKIEVPPGQEILLPFSEADETLIQSTPD